MKKTLYVIGLDPFNTELIFVTPFQTLKLNDKVFLWEKLIMINMIENKKNKKII